MWSRVPADPLPRDTLAVGLAGALTAVAGHFAAGDEPGVVAGEEQDDAGDVVRPADPRRKPSSATWKREPPATEARATAHRRGIPLPPAASSPHQPQPVLAPAHPNRLSPYQFQGVALHAVPEGDEAFGFDGEAQASGGGEFAGHQGRAGGR